MKNNEINIKKSINTNSHTNQCDNDDYDNNKWDDNSYILVIIVSY